jgi:hypothetical protein
MTQQMGSDALAAQAPAAPIPVIPYASPGYGAPVVVGAWRDGGIVVLYQSSELPDACVKCGGPPVTRLKRTVTWFPPLAYLGLLGGVLPFAVIAIVLQKKATVRVPLCGLHLQQRKRSILIAWGLSLGGLALAIVGPMYVEPALTIPLGILVFIIGVALGVIAANPLKPRKIDPPYAYLKGACELFLTQLPDVRQPAMPAPPQLTNPVAPNSGY